MNQTPPPEFYTNPTPPPVQPTPIQVDWKLPARVPWVTYIMMGLCIVVYLIQVATTNLLGYDVPMLLGAKINDAIIAGEYWRLFTPMWLHGSVLHIFFNMYALYYFGRGLEQHYGHERFMWLYMISGFAGNVVSFLFTTAASVGASTVIFGLAAAQMVFIYQNRALFGPRGRAMLINTLMIVGINLLIGLTPGIDNWGHVGGLMGGLAFAWLGGPLWQTSRDMNTIQVRDGRTITQARIIGVFVFLVFVLVAGIKIFH
jgi:rhomboid protease GluP